MNQQQAPKPQRPLPTSWVERIFEKLGKTYGRDFLSRWDGFDADAMDEVKHDWAEELSGFHEQPDAIAHALAHLPAKAPNVIEFRQLCRGAPKPEFKQLPRPTQDPQMVAEVVGVVKQKLTQMPKLDPKDWARKLKSRHDKGEKLAAHQITAYRQALGMEGRQSWQ